MPTVPTEDVFKRIRAEEQRLWIPGKGEVDVRILGLQRVCSNYDDRLVLARHELTGDWVVFITLDNGNLYPVIGIGRELISPDALRERLWKADAKRHGDKVLQEVNRNNQNIRDGYREKSDDASEAAAEAFEWGFRQEGVLPKKVFIPRNI